MAVTGGFWRKYGVKNGARMLATTHCPLLWNTLRRTPFVNSVVNKWLINRLVYTMTTRPGALSTMSDYTSWESLRDRTFSQRHLPPNEKLKLGAPPVDAVTDLFRRPEGRTEVSEKSTLLFPLFAQWFVDGFLRTDRNCFKKNTSTHEIDLSQLYGQTLEVTEVLRAEHDGLLESQLIDGQEFPPYYYENGQIKQKYQNLEIAVPGIDPKAKGVEGLTEEEKQKFFALGIPRGNIHYGFVMMSTLFLREHNRIARLIKREAEAEGWNDDEIFEKTRNTLIAVLLKIVIEDYINHITPIKFELFVEPGIGAYERWHRQNWMAVEFNLLYRWHTLVPTVVKVGGVDRVFEDVWWDTKLVTDHGLAALFDEASKQPCSTISLLNTDESMLDIERTSIEVGREVDLDSFNAYRAACGFPKLKSIEDLTSDQDVRDALNSCYSGDIDKVELFVGLFAEDVRKGSTLPTLMSTMVAVDAFSQALTNPLLDPALFTDATFSAAGMEVIKSTTTLSDIVARNTRDETMTPFVSLTRSGWRA